MKKILLILLVTTSFKIYSQHKLNSVTYNNSYKAEMLYDENNRNTSYKEYSFNSTSNEWESEQYGLEYFYTTDGLIDYTIFEESTYHNKYEYSYNSDNKLTEIIMSDQNENDWDLRYTETYNYDASNNNTEIIRDYANTWSTDYRYLNSFDSDNNLILREEQEWNTSTNSWNITIEKDEYTYNSDNKILSRQTSNLVDGVFEQIKKFEYTYDANGNREEWTSYNYDNNTNNWIGDEKVTYTYNNNYSSSDLIIPNWKGIIDIGYDEDYNHMILTKGYHEWNSTLNQWDYYSDAIFDWSDMTASVNTIETSIVKIYPNPVMEQLNFDVPNIPKNSKIEIFNIQGQLILQNGLHNKYLNVSNLNRGIYFFSINNIMKGKFIKK